MNLALPVTKPTVFFLKGRSNSFDESSRRYEDDERNYYSDDGTQLPVRVLNRTQFNFLFYKIGRYKDNRGDYYDDRYDDDRPDSRYDSRPDSRYDDAPKSWYEDRPDSRYDDRDDYYSDRGQSRNC